MGVGVSVGAIALGATVIEKHFTLDRDDGGVDSSFSMEPQEIELLVQESKRVWQGLGEVSFGPTESEKKSLMYRRSIYVSNDICRGDYFTAHNLKIIRPGDGLEPAYLEKLIGRRSPSNFKKGTPLTFEVILDSIPEG